MKRLMMVFWALLLGCSLAWGEPHVVRFHGTITAPAGLPSDLKVYVSSGSSDEYVKTLGEILLTGGSYDFTTESTVGSGINVYFNLGNNEYATYPYYGDDYRTGDYNIEITNHTLAGSIGNNGTNRCYGMLGDWDGEKYGAPMPAEGWYDYTVDIKIVAKGGAKASLIGIANYEGNYSNCAYGISVAISGNDYAKQTSTDYGDSYYDKVGCSYAYEFKDLELGTYTLTYSKEGYVTQTKQVEITEAKEIVVDPVTLAAKPVEYVFEGYIKYLNADNDNVYVEGAKITAYDGDGENANVVGGPVYTNAKGYWSMTMECAAYATFYFEAEHPNIVVTGRTSASAYTTSGVFVDISCTEKVPDLLGFETYKVKQVEVTVNGETKPGVEISWTWPKELIDNYKTQNNAEGVYKITSIKIMRPIAMEGLTMVGEIQPSDNELPATSFIDGNNPTYPLSAGNTYTYTVEISYSHPALGSVRVENGDDDRLKITLAAAPVVVENVTLTLTPSPADWGTVEGAGTYEKGDQVMIKAKANKGYLFKEWQKDGQTYATTAECKVTLTEDMTLTAVFEERPAILDSVTITLTPNDAKMGTVEGAGKYAKGEEVTITATPKAGYAFKQWKAGTTILSNKKSYTFVANTDSTITAVFEREIVYRTMINCKAKQIATGSIRLDWAWPQELIDGYKTDDNPDGIYVISSIEIGRKVAGATNPTTATIRPQAYTLPTTFYVDNSTEAAPLEVGTTYVYYMNVNYEAPAFKTVYVNTEGTDPNLKVTVAGSVDPVQTYTLALGVNNPAMGEATAVGGLYEYEEGDQVTVKATPKSSDYIFECWKEGEEVVSQSATYTFNMPGRNRTLTAVFVEKSQVTMATLTLNCDEAMGTVSGAGEFAVGTEVTVRAVPKEGYVFKAWNENGEKVHDKPAYMFVINADRTLEAVFAAQSGETVTVTISVEANDETMGTVTGGGEFEKGEQVTVTATPNTGFIFKGWQENGQMLNAPATYTFIANTDRTLTAVFTDMVEVTLQVNNPDMGTVTGAGQYKIGSEVTVKATPNEGYVFQSWMAGQTEVAATAEYKLVVSCDTTLTAVFAPKEKVKLTLEVNDAKMGMVEGAGEYYKGQSVTVKATPNEGYAFRAWQLDGETVSTEAEYTFVLNEATTLTAVFATHTVAGIVTLTLEVNDEMMGMVEGAGQYKKGTEVTVKAFANDGYKFQAWQEDGVEVSAESEYTFTLEDNRTLTAVFVELEANEDLELAAWSVFAENGRIVLHSNTDCRYEVYTLGGVLVKQGRMDTNACSVAVDHGGLYIVRRISSTGISVKKVVVR